MEEITEEQRKRAEANRLAALAKRKAATAVISAPSTSTVATKKANLDPWGLYKCRKIVAASSASTTLTATNSPTSIRSFPILKPMSQQSELFRVRLEVCSPNSFSVTPLAVEGFPYPGEASCFEKLSNCLSDVLPSHYTQSNAGGKACVYNFKDYAAVLRCLKNYKDVEYEEIPWGTFNVVERLSHSFDAGRWIPSRPEHLCEEKVDELIGKLPKTLLATLLPFQLEGVRFAVRRGGRCLIADEMGLGKTLQAIAITGCFMVEGPILIVCPAILRYSWAEELERWLPFCLPSDIHLVFGRQNNPAHLTRRPRVVVISYTMLHRLRKSMLEQDWAFLIIDESHHVRCTKKSSEPDEIKVVLDVASKVKHVVLLSGTPSLSRPGLLGKNKYDFAQTYCSVNFVGGFQGKVFKDYSKGVRLEELHVLLRQTVMIRRLKKHVLLQLPPKRRQIISLVLKRAEIVLAMAAAGPEVNTDASDACNDSVDSHKPSRSFSDQVLGIAKLPAFREWFSIHPIMAELDGDEEMESVSSSHKMIIFAHHHKVLDGLQEFLCEKGIGFVRIDGTTPAADRQLAIRSFQSSKEAKVAIIGILAGGTGLNLTSAQNVVFLELPKEPAHMLQAEDRAHRKGQTKAVNIYIFCAKNTSDESQWHKLNKSLCRVSSTMNGKYDAIQEIQVERVEYLESKRKEDGRNNNSILGSFITEEFSGGEKINYPNFCCDQDLQSVATFDETNEEQSASSNNFFQSNLHVKDEIISGPETLKCTAPNRGNEAKFEHACRVLSQELVERSENKDHMELDVKESSDIGCIEIKGGGERNLVQADSLRFEVSQYTGRIHLYVCIPGVDSRPRPLFENFQPQEVEAQLCLAEDSKIMAQTLIKDDPRFRKVLLTFINEWNKLRPIEQKKLLAKTLQLPLSVELSYLKESLNHDSEGLLKGGSKRRSTPWHEISHPLPSDAVWRKVHICSGYGKKEKEYTQCWTPMDEPLCKLCQIPCRSKNAKNPEFFEDLFCNLICYEEYRLRTSTKSLREGLFQVERGICTICQLNCHELVQHVKRLSYPKRQVYIQKKAPLLVKNKKLLEKFLNDPTEGNAWHADHIVPVYRGGGECTLENMRTLCVVCHADVTAAQRAERCSTRNDAKKQLREIINDIKNVEKTDNVDVIRKDSGNTNIQEKIEEEKLLITVPGSAYSRANNESPENQEEENREGKY